MSMRPLSRRALVLAIGVALAAGAQAQSAPASAGTPSEDDPAELDAVIVTGVRAAIFNARNEERERDVVSNIVSADDVGQFADQSVAESLQRVPGIGVDRDAGEARRLTVRGLGPLFNPVRLNGMLIGSSDLDRDAVVDILPNDLLGTLEVTKTLTPDMDGDAIGGAIDLKGIDPFERDPGGSLRVEASQQDYSGKVRPKVNGGWTTNFDTANGGRIGISLAGSYSDRTLEGDVLRNRDTPVYSRVGSPDRSSPAEGFLLRSVRAEQRFDVSERERAGVAGSVNWSVNPSHEFDFRFVASEFNREDVQVTNRYQFPTNPTTVTPTNQVVLALGPRTGTFRNAELRKQVTFLTRDESTWMTQLGGRSSVGEWDFNYWVGASQNEMDIPEQLTGRFRIRGITADVAQTADGIIVTARPGTAATSNPDNLANYAYDNLTLIQEFRTDDILTAQFDASRELLIADQPGRLKFGLKANRRDKDVDRQETSGNPSGAGGVPATTLAG
ncbi:MAG: TonB-dependent receptor plug domain-containing protein, partial [Silanimonas sp.]